MSTQEANDVRDRAISAVGDEPQGTRLTRRGLKQGAEGGRVDRDAEPNGAIYGLSVITAGEALGHGAWIDGEFLDQVVEAAKGQRIKSRFTHPDMSSDGLGKQLGRVDNLTRKGDQVYGDLHFLAAASKSPEGDLADYVLTLADESPSDFGTSIVFLRDVGAEDRFAADHADADGTFQSPDPTNTKNLPHWRLQRLDDVDVVDEPAANPGGLFSGRTSSFAAAADEVADYAFGITDEQPARALFDRVHPERVRRFMQGYLERRGFAVVRRAPEGPDLKTREKGEMDMDELQDLTIEQLAEHRPDLVDQLTKQGAEDAAAAEPQAPETPANNDEQLAAARDESAKEQRELLKTFREAFAEDEAFALEQFEAGASFEEAVNAYRDHENKRLKARVAELESRVGAAPVGHHEAAEGSPRTPEARLAKAKEYAAEHAVTITEALRAVSASAN